MQLRNGASLVMIGVLALCLVVPGCLVDQAARQKADARALGTASAQADVANGILKQKEYPPLPYSLQQINYIRLLKSECGVEWDVVNGVPDSPALRAEVAAYNDVMRGEIARKFGADIFQKLHERAEGK